jgi:hypothetical protein
MVNLGDKCRDVVTGFQGIAVGELKWLHGCRRINIEPPIDKDGKPIDGHWFDEQRVELVETRDVPDATAGQAREPGGIDAAPSQSGPSRGL